MIAGVLTILSFLPQVATVHADSPEWVPRNVVVDFLALEDQLQRALREADHRTVEGFLATEFEAVIVGGAASGLHRAEWLLEAPERKWEFVLDEVRSRCMLQVNATDDSDCWVVELNGMVQLRPSSESRFATRPFIQDLWVRRQGRWQIVSRLLFLPARPADE